MRTSRLLCAAIFLGGLTVGCSRSDRDTLIDASASTSAAATQAPSAATLSAELDDAQIVSVLRVANNAEIAVAEVATQKATTDEVRSYAQRMLLEHRAANDRVAAELGAEGPQDSPLSARIDEKSKAELDKLNALEGLAFEKAYVQGQVAMHQELLLTIDEKLFPATGTSSVRSLLQTVRTEISAHLAQAKAVETGLPEVTPAG